MEARLEGRWRVLMPQCFSWWRKGRGRGCGRPCPLAPVVDLVTSSTDQLSSYCIWYSLAVCIFVSVVVSTMCILFFLSLSCTISRTSSCNKLRSNQEFDVIFYIGGGLHGRCEGRFQRPCFIYSDCLNL